jgi:flagellar motor switch protein FliN/FliY
MSRTLRTIMKVEVPVIVRVGQRRMRLSEASALYPGSIIELTKPATDPLELLINNVHLGQGSAVKVGENFGIAIDFVGDVRARIQALGAQGMIADDADALADRFLNG